MALRLLEMVLDEEVSKGELEALFEDLSPINLQVLTSEPGHVSLRLVYHQEQTEKAIGLLEDKYSSREGFRILIHPLEAFLPRPESPDEQDEEDKGPSEEEKEKSTLQISTEELYQSLAETTRLNRTHICLAILSTLVAAIGLIRNDLAVIIGAMVIAPLLGPHIALSLGATLGDFKLMGKATKTIVGGIFLSTVFSLGLGFLLQFDPETPQMLARANISLEYIFLAFGCGVAGTFAFTSGAPAALVGVMVAVALLPPLVTACLYLSGGYYNYALKAGMLLFSNIICINLSSVLSFLFQGVRPRNWWEAERARKATAISIVIWLSFLAVFVGLIFLKFQV